MFNEVPNSNGTMHITNNVQLATRYAEKFSIVVIMQNSILVLIEKPTYQRRS